MHKPVPSAARVADSEPVARTARRINRRSVAVITLVALSGGIAGFAVMRDTFEQSVSQNLMLSATTSSTSLAHTLEVSLWLSRTVATRPTITQTLDKLGRNRDDTASHDLLQGIADSLIAAEITGAEFYDSGGRLAVSAGSPARSRASVAHRLSNTGPDAALAWADGYVLVAENQVFHAGRAVGRVITEQRLPLFDRLLKEVRASNEASDAAICGREGDVAICAPNRLKSSAFTIPMFDAGGHPTLPIIRAVLGERGVMRVKDRRGIEVMSAFTPIKDYGLGFAVKTDLDTLYAPLRTRTRTLALALVAVIALAIFIQRSQVRPVLARLVQSKLALQASQALLTRMGRVAGVGGWEFDLATSRLHWTDETRRIHDVAPDFVPTLENAIAFYAPEARSVIDAAIQAGIERGEPWTLELPLVTATGRHIWVRAQGEAEFHDGKPVRLVGAMQDITERMLAERGLRTLTAVFDATTDYVVQNDPRGRITYMNAAARRRTGVALDAPVEHLTLADLNPPQTLARFASEVGPTAEATGVWLGESLVWDAERREFPVSHIVIAHRDKHGKLEYFSGLMRDISGAKAAEQALRDSVMSYRESQRALQESEARLRTMADALPMRVAYVDAQERYQFNNLAYERAFKKSPAELYGKTVRELLGDAAYQAAEPNIRRVLSGEPVTFQSEMANGGNYVHYEAHYIPQFATDDGRVLGFHAVVSDITRQKLEERRLQQLARVDPLTGVVNRAGFELRLAEAMERCRGSGALMALMYLDIDRFKQINDQFGHNVGDALLRLFAGRLSRTLRSTDTIARLGGDEFTVIMEGLPRPEIASTVAAKIVQAMSTPFVVDSHTIGVTTSIGLAFHHGDSVTADELVKQADVMLYQAKDAGRNNVQMALRVTAVARA
jgi:diguanylate cyclase (GGDEF)-like protein/PAS domain S-box-containing protein